MPPRHPYGTPTHHSTQDPTARPTRLSPVDGTGSVAKAGGGSEAHACLVGRRTRHRG